MIDWKRQELLKNGNTEKAILFDRGVDDSCEPQILHSEEEKNYGLSEEANEQFSGC